jgi:hypothetical protein
MPYTQSSAVKPITVVGAPPPAPPPVPPMPSPTLKRVAISALLAAGAGAATFAVSRNSHASIATSIVVGIATYVFVKQKNL